MRQALPSTKTGQLDSSLTSHERKWVGSVLPVHGKRMGFRLFTRTPEFRERMALMLDEHEAKQRLICAHEGVEYISLDPFTVREKFKVEEWKKLSEEEKETWRERSRNTKGAEDMTECVLQVIVLLI